LKWSKLLYNGINFNDWIINSGDWYFDQNIYSQSSSYYESDTFSSITLNPVFNNSNIVTLIDMKYELEWDKDYFSLAYLNENGNILSQRYFSEHNFKNFNQFIFSFNQNNSENLRLNMSLDTDESLYYRGVIVNNIQILSDSGLDMCFYGDINFDGFLNINDIMKMLNYIFENEQALGYYRCVSDINQDNGINILDIAILITFILGD
jgi:hypothetical protein